MSPVPTPWLTVQRKHVLINAGLALLFALISIVGATIGNLTTNETVLAVVLALTQAGKAWVHHQEGQL